MAGAYIAKSDIEDVYGRSNVKSWGDLDNDGVGTKIDARIERAIVFAESDVNTMLSGGPYSVPFTGSIDAIIIEICAKLAGAWLYNARGTDDIDGEGKPINKTWANEKDARMKLTDIVSGKRKLAVTGTDKQYPSFRAQTYGDDGERDTVVSA